MEVSTDDTHDVKALPGLVEGFMRNVKVAKVIGDGAYDSEGLQASGESGYRGGDQASEELEGGFWSSVEEEGR